MQIFHRQTLHCTAVTTNSTAETQPSHTAAVHLLSVRDYSGPYRCHDDARVGRRRGHKLPHPLPRRRASLRPLAAHHGPAKLVRPDHASGAPRPVLRRLQPEGERRPDAGPLRRAPRDGRRFHRRRRRGRRRRRASGPGALRRGPRLLLPPHLARPRPRALWEALVGARPADADRPRGLRLREVSGAAGRGERGVAPARAARARIARGPGRELRPGPRRGVAVAELRADGRGRARLRRRKKKDAAPRRGDARRRAALRRPRKAPRRRLGARARRGVRDADSYGGALRPRAGPRRALPLRDAGAHQRAEPGPPIAAPIVLRRRRRGLAGGGARIGGARRRRRRGLLGQDAAHARLFVPIGVWRILASDHGAPGDDAHAGANTRSSSRSS